MDADPRYVLLPMVGEDRVGGSAPAANSDTWSHSYAVSFSKDIIFSLSCGKSQL